MRDHVVKFASINYHREVPMGQQVEVFYTPPGDEGDGGDAETPGSGKSPAAPL